jgi:hypothetical protein
MHELPPLVSENTARRVPGGYLPVFDSGLVNSVYDQKTQKIVAWPTIEKIGKSRNPSNFGSLQILRDCFCLGRSNCRESLQLEIHCWKQQP